MPNSVRETSAKVAERRARRFRQIVDAAWALARRDGLAALSMRDLGREVGMRAPSLYEYVSGKDDLYDAMFAEGYDALSATFERVPLTGDPRTDLATTARAFLRFCAADPARYQLMFTRAVPGWEPSPDAYAASVRSWGSMVEQLGTVGVTDPGRVDLWTAVVAGLAAQQAANDPGGDRYTRLVEDVVAMFLAGPPPEGETP